MPRKAGTHVEKKPAVCRRRIPQQLIAPVDQRSQRSPRSLGQRHRNPIAPNIAIHNADARRRRPGETFHRRRLAYRGRQWTNASSGNSSKLAEPSAAPEHQRIAIAGAPRAIGGWQRVDESASPPTVRRGGVGGSLREAPARPTGGCQWVVRSRAAEIEMMYRAARARVQTPETGSSWWTTKRQPPSIAAGVRAVAMANA